MEYPARRIPETQTWYTAGDTASMGETWYDIQVARILAGETIALPRNLDTDYPGRVWDIFTAGKQVGYIDDDTDGYDAYFVDGTYVGSANDFNSGLSLLFYANEVS